MLYPRPEGYPERTTNNEQQMNPTTTDQHLVIRPANENDVPLILQFIQELAEYERLSHVVVATEDLLREHLFGERKAAEVLLGYYDGRLAAFALYFQNFSTFMGRPGIYLEDLFVKPEYRRKGFGRVLLVELAKIAVERDYGRLEWSVLDWNSPAIDFYKSLGAIDLHDWTMFRLTGDKLVQLARSNGSL